MFRSTNLKLIPILCLLVIGISTAQSSLTTEPYVFILGVAQDAGYPQINCTKDCCNRVYDEPSHARLVASIAIVDPISKEEWVFDATPDFTEQLQLLNAHIQDSGNLPEGIFLTHAHIGHYTGLMYLGREAMGAKGIQVYAMPRMKAFLESNGPWSLLVRLNSIAIQELRDMQSIQLNERISVTAIQVPHRDEYSETAGYLIKAGSRSILFIPDIDKWELWEHSIVDLIATVDIALLDATFYKDGEINRAMSEVPHPFVEESIQLFKGLKASDKSKVHFIHFNHTNPLLDSASAAHSEVLKKGFKIASQGQKL